MGRFICAFVVRIWHKQVFSWRGSYETEFTAFSPSESAFPKAVYWAVLAFFLLIIDEQFGKTGGRHAVSEWTMVDQHAVCQMTYTTCISIDILYVDRHTLCQLRYISACIYLSWHIQQHLDRHTICGSRCCCMSIVCVPSICPVWSESLLSVWGNLGSLATLWSHSEDWSNWADAQAVLSLCWVHTQLCWFCHVPAHISTRYSMLISCESARQYRTFVETVNPI